MKQDTRTFVKVKFGSTRETTRIWLPGDSKSVIQQLRDKGFEVIEKRPSRATPKVVVAKTPKTKKVAKVKVPKAVKKFVAEKKAAEQTPVAA